MDYLTNYYRNKAEALSEQIQNLRHQLQLMEAGAWSPSSGGPAIPESDAGNNELRDRMRQIKQSGNRPQSKEYLEMEAELNRRTGVNQPKPEAAPAKQAAPKQTAPAQQTAVNNPPALLQRVPGQSDRGWANPRSTPMPPNQPPHPMDLSTLDERGYPKKGTAKAAPQQAAQAQQDRRLDGSDEGAPPARVDAQGRQYSPKPDWVKGREQIDFVKNMFAPLKNIKPAQVDRRLDGSDEGAPPVRVDAQGRQYSPMPDWAKNGQQSAPAPQGDTKVDTSKLYMGDDSWLKDSTAPLTLPGSFAGDRTQQTGQPQSSSQKQNNGLFARGNSKFVSLEQLSQEESEKGEALSREGHKLFYGKDVPSIKKSSGNSTKEGDSGTRIPSPRELMIGSPSDSAAPASEKRGLLGDLGNAFGNAAGALFDLPQSVNQALNRRVFVNK
jgi:hypothetical protein